MISKKSSILISGASIAGPALAYWLKCYGFTPTVIERAPQLREGGYPVDVRHDAAQPDDYRTSSPPGPAHARSLSTYRGEDGASAPMGRRDPETGADQRRKSGRIRER